MAMQVANLIPHAPASTAWPLAAVAHGAMVAVVEVVMAAAMVVAAVTAVAAAVAARSVAEQA